MQWEFQVSQGSAKTILRWGRKRFHLFAANLSKKWWTKFCRHRPSFIGDITNNILAFLFSGHRVFSCCCLFWLCSCVLYQWSSVWMLSCVSRHSMMMSYKVRKESCISHERYFPLVLRTKYKAELLTWMRSWVVSAYRRDWLWWNVPTALLCTSSVWRW